MSDPTCHSLRELLGVYVVGAIDPAERSVVDAHLNHCHDCREELAGLAVLPALLHRVSLADAERLLSTDAAGEDSAEPSPDSLPSLLRQVAAKRKARRLRAAFTVAAATLAVAGTAVVTSALSSHGARHVALDETSLRTRAVHAWVKYGKPQWGGPGTEMLVRVTGLAPWTRCKFWVVAKDGHKELAGGWLVGPDGSRIWYPAEVPMPKGSISRFVLTTASGTVLRIPADRPGSD